MVYNKGMKGYIINIEKETKENTNFRKVLYTGKNSQLVLMSLLPGEEIGMEVHTLDQFIRFEEGSGRVILDGKESEVKSEWAMVIPAGAKHNIINTGADVMKLYTVYSPPEHKDGIVHATRAEATSQEEHFDGVTTE